MTPAARLSALLDALRATPCDALRAEVRLAFDLAGLVYAHDPAARRHRREEWRDTWHAVAREVSADMLAAETATEDPHARRRAAHRRRRWDEHVACVGDALDAIDRERAS